MAGLIESMLAGGGQGAANASTQNTVAAQNMNLQQLQIEVKTLMDQRIAERAAQGEQAKYDRTREDAKADLETKHGYDLELMKERNKPYTTGARGSKAGARSVDFDRWKEDNPDGTFEEYRRMLAGTKNDEGERETKIAVELMKTDSMLKPEEALSKARKLTGREVAETEKKIPTKPLSAF
ncbi:MAG: hypothetical protein WC710_14885 [Gallionella sp.]|jgi:hypothetical protein